MYIKSLILDGFKSYGQRTEINGFDEEFNAVTGLNGSGKSNILDSICFVLGISNLSYVRAGNLQDLVYKRGQAGVTKASVTITFDNQDVSRSPLGYESFREITVTRQVAVSDGGKNKYKINGSTVQNKKVVDLFNSIQLNVNNPHFLIMQGRITKVLNMKPSEILSMVGEAAGTGMYDIKKKNAERQMAKKDAKLKEVEIAIVEDLRPKVIALNKQRSDIKEYQKITREVEHLSKIYHAWEYYNLKKTHTNAEELLNMVNKEIKETNLKVAQDKAKVKKIENFILDIQKKIDAESGSKLEAVEIALKEAEKLETNAEKQIKIFLNSIFTETKRKAEIDKNVKSEETALAAKRAELTRLEGEFNQLKAADQEDAEALAAAQRRFQAVSTNLMSSEHGEDATLQDQLMETKCKISQCQTESQQCKSRLVHSRTELQKIPAELKKTEGKYAKDKSELDAKEREVVSIEESLKQFNYEDGRIESLQEAKRAVDREMSALQQTIQGVEARNMQLRLRYKDPEPQFNHASVHGPLCKLFSVKDMRYARALEIAAGAKLYNVVVDNEQTCKKLLKFGDLERRVTFVPLNKIVAHRIDHRTVEVAQKLVGKEKVFPALSLIEYREEHRRAMEFAFGQTFVAVNMDVAIAVTYHKQILKVCVTLDGDTASPHGTLSGGAALATNPVLAEVANLVVTEQELKTKKLAFMSLESQISEIANVAERYAHCKRRLEQHTHEVKMVRDNLQKSAHQKWQQQARDLQTEIEEMTCRGVECKAREEVCTKRLKELNLKLANPEEVRVVEKEKAEAEMIQLKKKAELSHEKWSKREPMFDSLNLEIQELTKSVESGHQHFTASEEKLVHMQQDFIERDQQLEKLKTEVKGLQHQVKDTKSIMSDQSKDIMVASDEKLAVESAIKELELEFIRLDHNALKIQANTKEAGAKVAEMAKTYEWITTDEVYFGQPRGMYDFVLNNPEEVAKKIAILEESKAKLNYTTDVTSNNRNAEIKYEEALAKQRNLVKERKVIEDLIKELEKEKKKELIVAYNKVVKEFSSIFGSLLPGADATLRPLEGKTILDGLEVKVGFNGVMRDLGELSGGQRSLVALSLILAMLLFKPAPIYILDEVDAALDLSHTQNIGQMLKAHFKSSQFIIVSLQQGMYGNAGVLFETKFVDGVSTVMRVANNQD